MVSHFALTAGLGLHLEKKGLSWVPSSRGPRSGFLELGPPLREVSPGQGDRPPGATPSPPDPLSGHPELQNPRPTWPWAIFRASADLFPRAIFLRVDSAPRVCTPRLRVGPWVVCVESGCVSWVGGSHVYV